MKKALLPRAVLLQHGVHWHYDNALKRKMMDQLEKAHPCSCHGLQTQMGLDSQTVPPCSTPIHCISAAAMWLLLQHIALPGALCAATEFRLYQDENIVVLSNSITITATSRSNPSICEVYAKGSGNHTSGLFYLPSLGSLRVGQWIYSLVWSEGQFTYQDKQGSDL